MAIFTSGVLISWIPTFGLINIMDTYTIPSFGLTNIRISLELEKFILSMSAHEKHKLL
ncbi:6176_t:CDS:2 [Cetraspora pellucida]|uniref:6176_t:CDS:1 n=1 Tax=Cetraspora pellucida TaxID=1433469 RepID=A0A9N9AYN5_9GLOM|nr:6176_t:CDS:2 [Cetraspora pellucida]